LLHSEYRQPTPGDGAVFDAGQRHFGVGGVARGSASDWTVASVQAAACRNGGKWRHAACEPLSSTIYGTIKHDRDLAEKARAAHVRRDQKIVADQKRHCQHGRGAHDAHQSGSKANRYETLFYAIASKRI
jgi:hypothetical protein